MLLSRRSKVLIAISVAAIAGAGGGGLYALATGASATPGSATAAGHIHGCASQKHVASLHSRKCQKGIAPIQSPGPGARSSSSAPPPAASGSFDCHYQTDTWSGDASSVGYSVQKISSRDGKTASFSVRLNANRGTTEVVGYPSDQCLLYSALPHSLTSRYDVTPPSHSSGLDYEFAYDIWLTSASAARSNNWSDGLELMIWTYNRGQRPAGSKVTTLGDGSAVWFAGTKGANKSTVSVVLPSNTTSGTVDISSIVAQLKARGYIPSSDDGILDVEYGIEAPYGGGNTFAVNAFTVTG